MSRTVRLADVLQTGQFRPDTEKRKLTCQLLLNCSAGHWWLLDRPRGGRCRLKVIHIINISININKLQIRQSIKIVMQCTLITACTLIKIIFLKSASSCFPAKMSKRPQNKTNLQNSCKY